MKMAKEKINGPDDFDDEFPKIFDDKEISKSKITNSLDDFLNRLKKRINKKDNKKIRAKTAPQLECSTLEYLTPEEQAEYSVSEYSTAEVVDSMIVNAYSHLGRGNYEAARTQLSYLRTLDLPRVLDGDRETQERTEGAIKNLVNKLRR